MRYEWDNEKDWLNQQKHDGIEFARARQVFDDPSCYVVLDRIDETGEQRWHAIGAVPLVAGYIVVMLVVHVYRENRYGEEIIRIISARWADKHEIRRYQDQTLE